jgi:predicted ferric reductase
MFELFLKLHLLLAATTVIALIWHLIPRSLSLLWIPLMAVTLWLINRWCRRAVYYNKDGAEIGEIWRNEDLGIIRVKILMKDRTIMNRRFEPKPGQYYYLDFPQLPLRDRVQAHPFMLAWWTQSGSITNLTFLVEPQRGLTARLMKELSLSSVNIEGPYGQDLEVERYDTVMLVAKGVGIAGVLSYVRYLTERKSNDETVKAAEETEKMANCQRSNQQSDDLYRDHTRKIDLFWKLDHNGQAEWTSDYINELKNTWCAKVSLSIRVEHV